MDEFNKDETRKYEFKLDEIDALIRDAKADLAALEQGRHLTGEPEQAAEPQPEAGGREQTGGKQQPEAGEPAPAARTRKPRRKPAPKQPEETAPAGEPKQPKERTVRYRREGSEEVYAAPEEAYWADESEQGQGRGNSALYFVVVILVAALLALAVWLMVDDAGALTRPDEDVVVTVEADDSIGDVARTLKANKLIRYKWLFRMYCVVANADDRISAGTYELNRTFDYHALISGMSDYGTRATTTVVIPEGYTCSQIFTALEEAGVCTAQALYDAAANSEFDYWFLEGLAYGDENRLEGYLFPDTYEFYMGDSADEVLDRFLANFEVKFDQELQSGIDGLNSRLAEKMRRNGFSDSEIAAAALDTRDVVIVASLVEREAMLDSERATIASVIYNRLCSKDYPLLQIDATIAYILPEHKEVLTAEDQAIDDPYNTYKYPGLTPGPIANPGLDSLRAAVNPEDTDYYFYALETDNAHHFSETYSEHYAFLESQQDE